MATGTVSSFSDDVWQLIGTNTSPSGASINFTGVSQYKKLYVKWNNISLASTGQLGIRFNSESSNYASLTWGRFSSGTFNNRYDTSCVILQSDSYSNTFNGYCVIENSMQVDVPKISKGISIDQSYGVQFESAYNGTGPISTLQFIVQNGGNFSSGTVSLYGIAA